MNSREKTGFIPISIEEYIKLHTKSNPKANTKKIEDALKAALEDYKKGATCSNCGNPTWVIGSALAGWNACFSCITGEAMSDDDYEIDEAMNRN
jgi:hypothetical protein